MLKKFELIKNRKADIEISELVLWILAVAIFVIAIIVIVILRGKGSAALEYLWNLIKNIFTFGK